VAIDSHYPGICVDSGYYKQRVKCVAYFSVLAVNSIYADSKVHGFLCVCGSASVCVYVYVYVYVCVWLALLMGIMWVHLIYLLVHKLTALFSGFQLK